MENVNNTKVLDFTRRQANFISGVYGWMFIALLITSVTAIFSYSEEWMIKIMMTNTLVFYGLVIAEIGLVIYLVARIKKMSAQRALLFFLLYSVLNGLTLSLIFQAFTTSSIASTFGITALTFGVMSLYGYYTKTDLTKFGNILFMALIGLVIASVVNIFLHSEIIYWITSYIGVIIFTGLVAYDTQKIKKISYEITDTGDQAVKYSILAALTLYLDFINLFLFLLRIMGDRR